MLNPKSYDGARVLEASGRPMLVIGRSYGFDSIQVMTKLVKKADCSSSINKWFRRA